MTNTWKTQVGWALCGQHVVERLGRGQWGISEVDGEATERLKHKAVIQKNQTKVEELTLATAAVAVENS